MNLIERDESLILLDWEYAHVADRLWDLAGWSANNDFEAEVQRSLLTRYLASAPHPEPMAALQVAALAVRLRLLAVESSFTWACGREASQRHRANAQDYSTRACAFRHTTPLEEPREGSNGGF